MEISCNLRYSFESIEGYSRFSVEITTIRCEILRLKPHKARPVATDESPVAPPRVIPNSRQGIIIEPNLVKVSKTSKQKQTTNIHFEKEIKWIGEINDQNIYKL